MVHRFQSLDATFGALADPTRRQVLARLGHSDAAISELAARHRMTLTGTNKHVRVLEHAGLVTTCKVGRVRRCSLGPRTLDDAARWIAD
ncbi:MAG: helix-turn-helix transcriptional regulator, partial [Gemmatimonadota bacterium]|nr:helix-turn-helix transcriptional regulator [Gemmatimonadota bacterium]